MSTIPYGPEDIYRIGIMTWEGSGINEQTGKENNISALNRLVPTYGAWDHFFSRGKLHFKQKVADWHHHAHYLRVLQGSSAHVYLTRPFVLSWSMMEAMSCGCLIIASRTPPVAEMIEDSMNGMLVDFFSPREIADKVEEALEGDECMELLRQRARETIQDKYDLSMLMPRHLKWIKEAGLNNGL